MALLGSAMKEDFLYYLWENRLMVGDLQTAAGDPVDVVNPGYRNCNSGPDYLEAKIKIGGQLWAGHVELHVRTSDWNRHGHQHDRAYSNVVLHVVYENDAKVNDIPVLAVKGHFDPLLYSRYEVILTSRNWIACERHINGIQPFTINAWLERMAIERLQLKSTAAERIVNATRFDWEESLYRLLLRYFGMKVNSEAFESLAVILPFKTLMKHADQLPQLEAMLLGCAGFLEVESDEAYPQLLKREFNALRNKFNLICMPLERWKFMRMRPVNFPTVRLAQLAQMIHQHGCLFSKIKEAENINEVKALFDVCASTYWDTHFRFNINPLAPRREQNTSQPKHLGEGTADVLVINAVVPLLFCYGKFHMDERHCSKAMHFLEGLAAEDNAITRHFADIGVKAHDAMQSQALLHLHSHYCKQKRCLECSIGNILLQSNKD